MITEEITETQVESTQEERSTGHKGSVRKEQVKITKTPLVITTQITDQRTEALKSKGFDRITDNKYVKRFDANGDQRLLFIIFNNHNLKIINRENNLDLGTVIFESNNIKYLEDLEEYLD